MSGHICTSDSFFLYPELNCKSYCIYCGYIYDHEIGYIGSRCNLCGNIFCGEEWKGSIAKKRREKLGMTRKQIADKLGLSKHTIKAYEWKKCLPKYYDFTLKLYQNKIRMECNK